MRVPAKRSAGHADPVLMRMASSFHALNCGTPPRREQTSVAIVPSVSGPVAESFRQLRGNSMRELLRRGENIGCLAIPFLGDDPPLRLSADGSRTTFAILRSIAFRCSVTPLTIANTPEIGPPAACSHAGYVTRFA